MFRENVSLVNSFGPHTLSKMGLVFLSEMKCLPDSIKETVNHEHFTLKKTSRVFSAMGIDYSHKQNNNRPVEVDGRALDIIYNESALLTWTLPGLYVAGMVWESANACPSKQNHSSFTRGEWKFLKDSSALKKHSVILQRVWWTLFEKS